MPSHPRDLPRMEALLEYDKVKLSVYNTNYYNNSRKGGVKSPEVNAITKVWFDKLPVNGNRMVMDGGAAGDEAAVGVGFINAGKTVSCFVLFGLGRSSVPFDFVLIVLFMWEQADADRSRYNAYAKGEIKCVMNVVCDQSREITLADAENYLFATSYLLKDCKRHGNGAISHRPPNGT